MRRILLVLVVASVAAAASTAGIHAQGTDTWIGKWILNIDQSSWSPANLAPKSGTTVITASSDGGNMAVSDGVDAE